MRMPRDSNFADFFIPLCYVYALLSFRNRCFDPTQGDKWDIFYESKYRWPATARRCTLVQHPEEHIAHTLVLLRNGKKTR